MDYAIVSDPPYGSFKNKLDYDQYTEGIEKLKALQNNTEVMVLCCNLRLLSDILRNIDLKPHALIVWDKRPFRRYISYGYPLRITELIIFLGESKHFEFRKSMEKNPPYNRSYFGDSMLVDGKKRENEFSYAMYEELWDDIPPVRNKTHPFQKPVKLIERIIDRISDKTVPIFDPFEGSGTTGQACANLNRLYKGEDKYFPILSKKAEKKGKRSLF